MRSLRLLLSILSLLISIILSLITLFFPVWGNVFGQNFGLTTCSSCSNLQENWNWECFARESCYNNQDPYCKIYSKGYYASTIYMYIEIGFLITAFILLEKLVLMLTWKDCGSVKSFYATLALNLFLQVCATISWYEKSKGSESGYEIESQAGPKISIAACVWVSLSNSMIFYFVYKEDIDSGGDLIRISTKCCGIDSKFWIVISLVLFLLSASLIIASLSIDNWIFGPNFKGGLIRCKNCQKIENLSWGCLAGTECSSNSDSALCTTYSNLSQAGKAYLVLSTLALFFILMAIQVEISNLTSRKYGLYLLNYGYLGAAVLLQLVSTITWGKVAGAKVEMNCNGDNCGDTGINLAIASNIFLMPACIIYLFAGHRAVKSSLPTIELQDQSSINEHASMVKNMTEDKHTERPSVRPSSSGIHEKSDGSPMLGPQGNFFIADEILKSPSNK